MKVYIYETESMAFDSGGVEVVIVVAENREAADAAMLKDPQCWVSDQKHLDKVYKVQEKELSAGIIFRAEVLERIDLHKYK